MVSLLIALCNHLHLNFLSAVHLKVGEYLRMCSAN